MKMVVVFPPHRPTEDAFEVWYDVVPKVGELLIHAGKPYQVQKVHWQLRVSDRIVPVAPQINCKNALELVIVMEDAGHFVKESIHGR